MRFRDRADAGARLGTAVVALGLADPVVLGLPRGGVPVGAAVAAALGAPLDVFVVCKVGAPRQPELGIGAVAEGGATVADDATLHILGIDPDRFDALAAPARAEVDRRVQRYRPDRALLSVAGRDVVVVDDGLATGVTAEAAVVAVRALRPRRVVLAIPVGAPDSVARLARVADDVVCVHAPADLAAVGRWYDDFAQVSDREVLDAIPRR